MFLRFTKKKLQNQTPKNNPYQHMFTLISNRKSKPSNLQHRSAANSGAGGCRLISPFPAVLGSLLILFSYSRFEQVRCMGINIRVKYNAIVYARHEYIGISMQLHLGSRLLSLLTVIQALQRLLSWPASYVESRDINKYYMVSIYYVIC